MKKPLKPLKIQKGSYFQGGPTARRRWKTSETRYFVLAILGFFFFGSLVVPVVYCIYASIVR